MRGDLGHCVLRVLLPITYIVAVGHGVTWEHDLVSHSGVAPCRKEVVLNDSVAVDAKRILLRYGVPIGILDSIQEHERIAFARSVSKTPVPERTERLLDLLVEHGYLDAETAAASARKYRKSARRK